MPPGRPKSKNKKQPIRERSRMFTIRIDIDLDDRLKEASRYTQLSKGAILSACLRTCLGMPSDSPIIDFVSTFTRNCPHTKLKMAQEVVHQQPTKGDVV